jgi:hypothetical protein
MVLQNCPFCGGKLELKWLGGPMVVCVEKGCFFVAGQTVEEVIAKANTRPLEDALHSRIAELEEAQQWISVEERLPEDGQETLCWLEYEKITYGIYIAEKEGWARFDYGGWIPIYGVTHWATKPLPPAE